MKGCDFAAERGPLFLRLNAATESELLFPFASFVSGTAARRPPARPQGHSLPHGVPIPHLGEILHIHFPRIGRESGLGEIKKHRRTWYSHTHTYGSTKHRQAAGCIAAWVVPWAAVATSQVA